MSAHDVDGLNSGYARLLLEDYLENPEAVPAEWRELFESGDSELVASHPGLLRLLETLDRGNGHPAAAPEAPAPAEAAPAAAVTGEIDETLLGGVAAAMALVKAHRMHGHLAARLDPLGSEPLGDPALDETRLIPPLTPELQARIPAKLLRVHVPGETLLEALPALREVYCGTEERGLEPVVEDDGDAFACVDVEPACDSPHSGEQLTVGMPRKRLELGMALAGREQGLCEVHSAAAWRIASTIGS